MTPAPSTSRDLARGMFVRETAGLTSPTEMVAALQRVCSRSAGNLRRAVGDDGFAALLARALRTTEAKHPILANMSRIDDAGIHLEWVVASVDAHGLHAVSTALEALLAALIDILGSLIGADMVLNLLNDDTKPTPPRTEPEPQ